MLLSSKTKTTFALAIGLSVVGAMAWAQNLEVKGSAWFATGGAGNAGIGTHTPQAKLHVLSAGGFGAENSDGTSQIGNVPIVAQSDSTAFGILNSSDRQVFALNVNGNGGTTSSRGYPVLYDKADGAWHPDLVLRQGAVGVAMVPQGRGTLEVAGNVVATEGSLVTTCTPPCSSEWRIEPYGGGFYMQDSYWIRTVGSRAIWTESGLLGSQQGLTVGYGGTGSPTGGAIVAGAVGIGTAAPAFKLDVAGAIAAGNSDLYFTSTQHNHTGIGNTAGYAAIENAANFNTLMILGRSGTPQGRRVDVWDYLQVNGTFVANGNANVTGTFTANGNANVNGTFTANGNANVGGWVGIGTGAPIVPLDIESWTDFGTGGRSYEYMNAARTGNAGPQTAIPVSLYAAQRIVTAGEVDVLSDAREKNILDTIDPRWAADRIEQLRPATYTWKDGHDPGTKVGFIAQEVERIVPGAVSKMVARGYSDLNVLNYDTLFTLNVAATKYLIETVARQQAEIDELKSRLPPAPR